MAAKCKVCGDSVIWAMNQNGKWIPPLEPQVVRVDLPEEEGGGLLLSWDTNRGAYVTLTQSDTVVQAKFHQCRGYALAGPDLSEFDTQPPVQSVSIALPAVPAPRKLSAREQEEEKRLRLNAERTAYWQKTRNLKAALRVQCPQCYALVNEPCMYLGHDLANYTISAHSERHRAAPSSQALREEEWRAQAGKVPETWYSGTYFHKYMEVACPHCEVPAGEPCLNMTVQGIFTENPPRVYNRTPHVERVAAWKLDASLG